MEDTADTGNTDSLKELNRQSSDRIVISRIERIIEKYSEVWRVLHEPVQNSIDAVQNREDIERGEITLEIYLQDQRLVIEDNGRGFPQKIELLLPDGTDKDEQQETMGYQGVGLKSVVYSSEEFELSANTGDDAWGIEITNAAGYLESGAQTDAPISLEQDGRDDRGTSLDITFAGQQVVEALDQVIEKVTESETNSQLKWEQVREDNYYLERADSPIEEFEYILDYYLKTQTYIGSLNRLTNCRLKSGKDILAKPVKIDVVIYFQEIDESEFRSSFMKEVVREMEDRNSILEIEMKNKFVDFQERVDEIEKDNPRSISFDIYDFDVNPRGSTNNPKLRDNTYVKILTPDYSSDNNDPVNIYEDYFSILRIGDKGHYQKMQRLYSDFFDRVLSVYIMIGRMDVHHARFIGNNYGMKFIAANGVPTAHELTPRSSNQSFYFNPITFILNVDGKLNEGKKELVDDSLKRKSRKYFRDAFEATLNRLAKSFVRDLTSPKPPPTADLVDENEIDIDGIDFTRSPIDENTLIGLFYQILRKKNEPLPTYGLLSQGVYDGKFVYEDDDIRSDNDLLNLEFKVDLKDLVNDFDNPNKRKNSDDCDLIIVWNDNITTAQSQDWGVVNKQAMPTQARANDISPNWITTSLRSPGQAYTPMVIVSDVVDSLQS